MQQFQMPYVLIVYKQVGGKKKGKAIPVQAMGVLRVARD
jgi:hypothetical protein